MSPPNLSLLLVMVCFWITLWLVHRYLIGPVGRTLAERRGRVDGAEREWSTNHEEYLSASERLQAEMEEAAREAARVRAARRQEALSERQHALEEARAAADGRLADALAALDSAAESARAELRRRAEDLSRLFASTLLEREVGS